VVVYSYLKLRLCCDFESLSTVPVGVQAPVVNLIESRRLGISWSQPTIPNGVITRFEVFVDNVLRFTGPENNTIIDFLSPFTEYSVLIQGCTSVGCSNSSVATVQTLPDQPMGLAAPNLTALSPSSIEAVWAHPLEPNGAILRFELRLVTGAQPEIIFNGLGLETTITGLSPNTLYTYQLFVFNAGGFASSSQVSVRTLEGTPDGVTAPIATIIDPTSLNITWLEPTRPNGIINQYILLQDGSPIFTGLSLSFVATGLQPFTQYSYSIMACTVRNCSSSPPLFTMTPESTPTGYTPPTVVQVTPFSIELSINQVGSPNGLVYYVLNMTGSSEALFNSSTVGNVVVDGLSPFTEYVFVLAVSNSAGTLIGEPLTVTTLPTGELRSICLMHKMCTIIIIIQGSSTLVEHCLYWPLAYG